MPARLVSAIVVAPLLLIAFGCSHQPKPQAQNKPPEAKAADPSAAFFESPEAAVPAIDGMLRSHSWPRLASYYDLTGSGIDRATLESGAFFQPVRSDRPAQPAGVAGQWQPFAPGFTYVGTEHGRDETILRVIVHRQIDQGGGMTQRVVDSFPMRKSARGYQILPKPLQTAPTTTSATATAAADESAEALKLLLAYRPALRDRLVALPPPELASLPALLDALDRWKHKLQIAPIGPPTTRTIAGGVISHECSDEELVISEIGRRIEQVLRSSDPKEVEAILMQADRNGGINTSYGKIVIHRADAAGTGPVYYADAPVRTPIAFKRMRPF